MLSVLTNRTTAIVLGAGHRAGRDRHDDRRARTAGFDIAGDKAGAVLGTALAIKMLAYVGVAPVVGGLANYLPQRAFLVSMDLMRAAVATRCRSPTRFGRSTS